MNEEEIEVSRVLISFEQIIEEHSEVLQRLENLLSFPQIDIDKANLLTKRLKRLRKEIKKGIDIILKNYQKLARSELKEEAYGICSYLREIGIPDEIELLEKLRDNARENGYILDLSSDIKEAREFIEKLSQFSF
ncbi:MAG: hypothetical protein QXV69_02310 [Sulfolobaceae archaeon]